MNLKSYVVTWTPRSNNHSAKQVRSRRISRKSIRIQIHGWLVYKLIWSLYILNRVGSILVPRGVFRLIIGCTFIVKICTICVQIKLLIIKMFLEWKINDKYYVNYLDLFAFTSQSLWEPGCQCKFKTLKNSPRNQDRAYFLLYYHSNRIKSTFFSVQINWLSVKKRIKKNKGAVRGGASRAKNFQECKRISQSSIKQRFHISGNSKKILSTIIFMFY
jgi:hypothetical protein